MRETERRRRSYALQLGAVVAVVAAIASACGGSGSTSSAASTPASDPTVSAAGFSRTPGRGFANRTPRPEIATAIAEGTPPGAFRGSSPGGGIGGGRTLTELAALLAIDEAQLRSELQVPGATITSVAAAHGMDRASLRQALVDATRQRLGDAVTNGTITQQMADQDESQFESNIDNLLDSDGARPFASPPASP